MHIDSRILQNFTTAELLYFLVSLQILRLQGKWYGLFREKTRKKQQDMTISRQLRQARSQFSRVHSYWCNKNGKVCNAGNELVLGVLSNDTMSCSNEAGATKLQGRAGFIQVTRNLALGVFLMYYVVYYEGVQVSYKMY